MRLTHKDIGKEVYPIDNSYAYNQRTGKNDRLAGSYIPYDNPQLVKLILSPFKMSIEVFNTKYTHEFVVVEDQKGDRHVILNNFYDSKEDMEESMSTRRIVDYS